MADKLKDALFKLGHILPSTDEEIEELDKLIKKKELPKLPDIFLTPSDLIKQKSIKIIPMKVDDEKTKQQFYEPMARVAREGKTISNDVTLQMKKDRQDAEERQQPKRD